MILCMADELAVAMWGGWLWHLVVLNGILEYAHKLVWVEICYTGSVKEGTGYVFTGIVV